MIIAAISDVHSPRYFDAFVKAVEGLRADPNLFLIAGDMIGRGLVREYSRVYNVLFGKIDCPIIACFGNSEFIPDKRDEIRKEIPEIKFLDDETTILNVKDASVGIVGSTGSLDSPTRWQAANLPHIREVYEERVRSVNEMLSKLSADVKILLTHYAPTHAILGEEDPRIHPQLACRAFERVLIERKPDLAVCGHSHHGKRQVWIDTVPVFNAGLLVNKGILVFDTKKLKPGLEKFLE